MLTFRQFIKEMNYPEGSRVSTNISHAKDNNVGAYALTPNARALTRDSQTWEKKDHKVPEPNIPKNNLHPAVTGTIPKQEPLRPPGVRGMGGTPAGFNKPFPIPNLKE